MNKMISKSKIEFCNYVWNTYWGCEFNCFYCFAKNIANRFWENILEKEMLYRHQQVVNTDKPFIYHHEYEKLKRQLKNFEPVFLHSNFERDFPRKPSIIFVNSMSDIAFWEIEDIKKVINRIKLNPKYIFLFFTKSAWLYEALIKDHGIQFPSNCYLGVTTDGRKYNFYAETLKYLKDNGNNVLLVIEPYIKQIHYEPLEYMIKQVNWVIVGQMTGIHASKNETKKEWLEILVKICALNKIPYFVKNNLVYKIGGLNQYYPDLIEKLCQIK